jgi:ribose 5-phosphate isomerase B
MDSLSDSELHELVQKVVRRTLLGEEAGDPRKRPLPAPHESSQQEKTTDPKVGKSPDSAPRVALGADHGGFALKQALKADLIEQGYQVIDCGAYGAEAVDYPDFAHAVASLVGDGRAWRGIIVDGAGIGSCMVANKVPGVRAAMCYDHATVVNSREHNNANVLTLGAKMISENLAKQIVNVWLTTLFGGGRHAKRVNKIMAVEHQYLKRKD